MKQHVLGFLSVALVLGACTATADAADPVATQKGQVPSGMLAMFGLGDMQRATDADGAKVRGMTMVFKSSTSKLFVTDVNSNALSHSKLGNTMPGMIVHDLANRRTTIMYHPRFGTKSVP